MVIAASDRKLRKLARHPLCDGVTWRQKGRGKRLYTTLKKRVR